MSTLFGYYGVGLRALSAAQLGIRVAGENIANASTPGFLRRRIELTSGFPIRVQGGMLGQGVDVEQIRRIEDRFLQASLERELGLAENSGERLRGLQQLESLYGTLEGDGILSAYTAFSDAFSTLAGGADRLELRQAAVDAADVLAGRIRSTYAGLEHQRASENDRVEQQVGEINRLARQLAALNEDIVAEEADGSTASPLRDERQLVVEQLAALTGGSAIPIEGNQLAFSFAGGPTLVTAAHAIELTTTRDASGMVRILVPDGTDVTDSIREGKLGAILELRDEVIVGQMDSLDNVAQDLITRANALTRGAQQLDGANGTNLFRAHAPPAAGAARSIAVVDWVKNDPRLLAVSSDGTPGDGSVAIELSKLQHATSAQLGGVTPSQHLSGLVTSLGSGVARADVDSAVSATMAEGLRAQREAVGGVSLDEEAVELLRHQRAFEAAAQFIRVINEITELAVNLR